MCTVCWTIICFGTVSFCGCNWVQKQVDMILRGNELSYFLSSYLFACYQLFREFSKIANHRKTLCEHFATMSSSHADLVLWYTQRLAKSVLKSPQLKHLGEPLATFHVLYSLPHAQPSTQQNLKLEMCARNMNEKFLFLRQLRQKQVGREGMQPLHRRSSRTAH